MNVLKTIPTLLLLLIGSMSVIAQSDGLPQVEKKEENIRVWMTTSDRLPGFSEPTYVTDEGSCGAGSYYQDIKPGVQLFAGSANDTLVNKQAWQLLNILTTMPDKPYLADARNESDATFSLTGPAELVRDFLLGRQTQGLYGQEVPGRPGVYYRHGSIGAPGEYVEDGDIDRLDFSDNTSADNRIIIGVPTQPDGRMLYGELQPSCGLSGYVAPQEPLTTTIKRTSGNLPFKVTHQGYGSMVLQKGGSYVQVAMPSEPGVYHLDPEFGSYTRVDTSAGNIAIAFSIVPIEDSSVEIIEQLEEQTEGDLVDGDLADNKYYGLSAAIQATGLFLQEDLTYNALFAEPGLELDIKRFRFGAYVPIGYMEASPEEYHRWESTWMFGLKFKAMWDILPLRSECRFGPYVSYTLLKGFSEDRNSVMEEVGSRAGIDYLHLGGLGLEFDFRRWSVSGGLTFTPWDFGSYSQPNDHRNDKTLTGDIHNGAWGLSATVGYRLIQSARPQNSFYPIQ